MWGEGEPGFVVSVLGGFGLQSRNRAGAAPAKGPWPTPAVDAMEEVLERYVRRYPQYGHRRIHAIVAADGHSASPSTVLRAMQRMRRHPQLGRVF